MAEDHTLHRIVALYADVSGSTRIYEQYGDADASRDIGLALRLLSEVAAHHGGRTVQTIGDEVLCAFGNPRDAARASARMHARLREASAGGNFRCGTFTVKIAWHYGPAEWRGEELVGETPMIAQQIIALAKPEEVLISGGALAALGAESQRSAQRIDTLESAIDAAAIEVFRLPWEEDADATEFRAAPLPREPGHEELLLACGTQQVLLDASKRHCRIGRTSDNDLVVGGRFTSRHHAEVVFRHGRFYLRDDSVNGTVVSPEHGRRTRVHREEGVLSGCGTLLLGSAPEEGEIAVVSYECR